MLEPDEQQHWPNHATECDDCSKATNVGPTKRCLVSLCRSADEPEEHGCTRVQQASQELRIMVLYEALSQRRARAERDGADKASDRPATVRLHQREPKGDLSACD
jgi:hypothetical protein